MNKITRRDVIVGNSPNLPRELLEEILSRLPHKSLVLFKCVCKYWYALFNDPVFLSHHLSNFIKNHNSGDSVLLRLSFPTIFGDGFENYKLLSLCSKDASYSAVETFKPKINMLSTKFQISGHCNGILCLSVDYWPRSKGAVLFNPATREFQALPDSVMSLKCSLALAVGMGYDSQTDDYKVIRIWGVDPHGLGGVPRTNRVEEYALSTDTWSELSNTNAGDFIFGADCFAIYFRGTYYWWAFERRDKSSVILALNMGDGIFQKVPLPDHIDISKPDGRSLVVWSESVSLICCTYYGRGTFINIWVMDGFGAAVSWTKMHSITHLSEDPKPLVFWKGNELLMEMSSGKIKSYNVDTQEIKNVEIEGHPVRYSSQAVNYAASLASIKRGTL